jgi:two-component system NtrC family sensor kinase
MLRTKLFQAFAGLVLIVGLLSTFFGIRMIRARVVAEAQTRVTLNLGSAWEACHYKLDEVQTILKLVASKKLVLDTYGSNEWDDPETRNRLEAIRVNLKLDFLTVVDMTGRVVLRATPPHNKGDFRPADPAVAKAMQGELVSGMQVYSQGELEREGDGLVEKALIALEETRHARPRAKSEENRGLAMVAAAPVIDGAQVLGVIYGGVLLNRNHALVDKITDTVFRNETYDGQPIGAATIFLDDCRIATTVRQTNGNRALGTRASKEVSDQVLDNARPWMGPAFVLNNRCLTAYDPIRDLSGNVVGMLYVGILEAPFTDVSRNMILRYALLLAFGLAVGLALAYVMAGRLSAPIHRLGEASTIIHRGGRPDPVPVRSSCTEVENLVHIFNEMALKLAEREDKLKETNESLKATNRNYMETLGFVSHELKNPISTMMNYVYLLKGSLIGPVNEKQQKAVTVLEANLKRLVEMVRHYLNLSRIENGELQPMPAKVALQEDVLQPLLLALEPDAEARHMQLQNLLPPVAIHGDASMLREVFENLVSNAIKYGREGGIITLGAKRFDRFMEFAVRNTGEGIPADRLDKVFQKFSRLTTGAQSRQKGTGLGLFITKAIVEAHGGRIEVENHPGEWIEFRFTLPLEKDGA